VCDVQCAVLTPGMILEVCGIVTCEQLHVQDSLKFKPVVCFLPVCRPMQESKTLFVADVSDAALILFIVFPCSKDVASPVIAYYGTLQAPFVSYAVKHCHS
jgi:hypothetical protein